MEVWCPLDNNLEGRVRASLNLGDGHIAPRGQDIDHLGELGHPSVTVSKQFQGSMAILIQDRLDDPDILDHWQPGTNCDKVAQVVSWRSAALRSLSSNRLRSLSSILLVSQLGLVGLIFGGGLSLASGIGVVLVASTRSTGSVSPSSRCFGLSTLVIGGIRGVGLSVSDTLDLGLGLSG